MLDAVTEKLCSELKERGIEAVRAFPAQDVPDGAAVAVGLKKASVGPGGFGDYLGLAGGEERFGVRCRAVFSLDIFSPPPGGSAGLSKAADALMAALGSMAGGGSAELNIGAAEFDAKLCRLRCRCELGAQFWLVRESAEPGGGFEEFVVKGMILDAIE